MGSLRIARFTKHLPTHGWHSTVVTVRDDPGQPHDDSPLNAMQTDDLLVADTVDEDAMQIGYFAERFITQASPEVFVMQPVLSGPVSSMHGTGFYIPPGVPGHFSLLWARIGTLDGELAFGQWTFDDDMRVSLEYMPRFLYV